MRGGETRQWLTTCRYNSLTFITSTDSATCTLFLNGPLLAAIAGLYLLFAVALTATLMGVPSSSTPLVTLGDAIDSFLSEPDSSTESACLVNKADISSGRWGCGQARYWFTEPHRWGNTPSLARWIVWTVSWLLPTGMAAALVALAAMDKKDGSSTRFSSFTGTTATYALPRNIGQPGLSLLVALPQLLVAALYLATNALLSVQHLSHEFSQFSAPGASHGLRVSSSPRGVQTVALHLTLPAAWSWATMVVFAAQGLMLAQGFRVVHSDGGKAVSIGLNAVPLVVLLFLLVVVGTGVGLLSLRRAVAAAAADAWSSSEEVNLRRRGGNPLALRGGSCSAVISSRCHPAEGDAPGGDVAAWPLTWGVVTEGAGGGGSGSKVGHAAFSSQPVGVLSVAKAYA